MWDLAVREADYEAAEAFLRHYHGVPPPSMRWLLAFVRGDSASRQAAFAEARTAENRQPQIAARFVATHLEDLQTARELARLSTAPARPPSLRAGAHLVLAWLEVAAGRWSEARVRFAAAEELDEADARVNRALAATLPFLHVPRLHLVELRDDLERWNPDQDPPRGGAPLALVLRQHLRLYLLGLVNARLGDEAAVTGHAAALEHLSAPVEARETARALARTLRADALAHKGRWNDALAALNAGRDEVPLELVSVPAFATVREYGLEHGRFLRAHLLSLLGRHREALRWAETGLEGAPNEFAYRAPLHHLRAELAERLGDVQAAVRHYQRFADLWRDCDPEMRPRVEQARDRIARLAGEGG